MKVLGNNVLVSEHKSDEATAGGIILSSDISTGNKPAIVIATSGSEACLEAGLQAGQKIYLDWTKAFAVELDGVKCATIDVAWIKLIVDDAS